MRISDWRSDVCSSDLVQAILPRVQDRRVVTYGFSAQADIRGENVQPVPGGNRFDVVIRNRDGSTRRIEGIEMPMPGRHNVLNAMAAIGVRSEEHTSELQPLMRISYAVFCLKKKIKHS